MLRSVSVQESELLSYNPSGVVIGMIHLGFKADKTFRYQKSMLCFLLDCFWQSWKQRKTTAFHHQTALFICVFLSSPHRMHIINLSFNIVTDYRKANHSSAQFVAADGDTTC